MPVSLESLEDGDLVDLVLRSIRAVMCPELFECLLGSLVASPGTEGDIDPNLMDYLRKLGKGEIRCQEAEVPNRAILLMG